MIAIVKKIILCVALSSWILLLNIPIYQQGIFFSLLATIFYLGFFGNPKYRYYVIGFLIISYFLLVVAFFKDLFTIIAVFQKYWSTIIFLPVLIWVHNYFKNGQYLKNIVIAVGLIVLLGTSVGMDSIVETLMQNRLHWIAFLILLLEVVFFIFLPLYLNLNNDLPKINFTLELSPFFLMIMYLFGLIFLHQMIVLVFNNTIFIPEFFDFKKHYVSFIASFISPAFDEEIIYRGFFYNVLITKLNSTNAMIITAIAFGLAHFRFGIIFAIFSAVLSIFATRLYQKTGSLTYSILLHGLINAYL